MPDARTNRSDWWLSFQPNRHVVSRSTIHFFNPFGAGEQFQEAASLPEVTPQGIKGLARRCYLRQGILGRAEPRCAFAYRIGRATYPSYHQRGRSVDRSRSFPASRKATPGSSCDGRRKEIKVPRSADRTRELVGRLRRREADARTKQRRINRDSLDS
jgi:hypothetical protein